MKHINRVKSQISNPHRCDWETPLRAIVQILGSAFLLWTSINQSAHLDQTIQHSVLVVGFFLMSFFKWARKLAGLNMWQNLPA